MINKLVYGVGLNDADYKISSKATGKKVLCPFYLRWRNMLARCYSGKYQERQPTYIGCTVCEEWLTFSNFKKWMEAQDWQGKALDKDVLFEGNKIYSPETCAFVDVNLNSFLIDRAASRGDWPVGVCFYKRDGNFMAQCSEPFTNKRGRIGLFDCPEKAHEAWRKRKHELALLLADLQTDERVAAALRDRFSY